MTSDEINSRASEFDPKFEVSRQQVDYYRSKYSVKIDNLRERAEFDALNEGLAKASERVALLKRLANKMVEDLFDDDLIWTDEVKGVGSGDIAQIVNYEEFNASEVRELRGVLDDIAKEVGGRVQNVSQKTEHTGSLEIVFGEPIPKRIAEDED